jgi:hypothetical protein
VLGTDLSPARKPLAHGPHSLAGGGKKRKKLTTSDILGHNGKAGITVVVSPFVDGVDHTPIIRLSCPLPKCKAGLVSAFISPFGCPVFASFYAFSIPVLPLPWTCPYSTPHVSFGSKLAGVSRSF